MKPVRAGGKFLVVRYTAKSTKSYLNDYVAECEKVALKILLQDLKNFLVEVINQKLINYLKYSKHDMKIPTGK